MLRAFLVILGLGLAVAVGSVLTGHLGWVRTDPWPWLGGVLLGALTPDFGQLQRVSIWQALWNTAAVAVWGTALGAVVGWIASLGWRWRAVRVLCAAVRAVHELVWALLLIPLFGTSALCAVAALALPAAGMFAKVLAEIRAEADPAPARGLPVGTGALSRFCYGVLPVIWPTVKHYVGYRFECALRASAVLGFIGIHTIGFDLEAHIREGEWSQAAMLFYLFVGLVLLTRWGLRPWSSALLLAVATFSGAWSGRFAWGNFQRTLGEMLPYPLRRPARDADDPATWGERIQATGEWFVQQLPDLLEGTVTTVAVALMALATSVTVAWLLIPIASRRLVGRWPARAGELALMVIRNAPEYVLAFALLLIFGPSMLPAVLAIGIHNGAILAHLGGHAVDRVPQGHAPPRRRSDRYAWELAPRIAPQQLAFALYRFEWMVRESAILGLIGVGTLGFHVDSAIENHWMDEAALFTLAIVAVVIVTDAVSHRVRRHLRVTDTFTGA